MPTTLRTENSTRSTTSWTEKFTCCITLWTKFACYITLWTEKNIQVALQWELKTKVFDYADMLYYIVY